MFTLSGTSSKVSVRRSLLVTANHPKHAMPPPNPALRQQVLAVYRELLNLSKDWPETAGGPTKFRSRLHGAFASKTALHDETEIRAGIERAQFVRKGWSRHPPFMDGPGPFSLRTAANAVHLQRLKHCESSQAAYARRVWKMKNVATSCYLQEVYIFPIT